MQQHNTLDKACDKGETSEEPNSYHRVVENLARRFLFWYGKVWLYAQSHRSA